MKRKRIILFMIVALILVFVVAAISLANNKKVSAAWELATTSADIVKIEENEQHEWFLTRMEAGQGYQQMKKMMADKGWTYLDQEGSGYFFKKGDELRIVTTQMWTGRYVLVKVPKQGEKQGHYLNE